MSKAAKYYEFPTSESQKRLWVLSHFEGGNNAYNISCKISINGPFNYCAFQNAINKIVARHESLRTTFKHYDDKIVQIIAERKQIHVDRVDLCNISVKDRQKVLNDEAQKTSLQPFDLQRGPLLRLKLIKFTDTEFELIFVVHHTIADGWSLSLLIKELSILYRAYTEGSQKPNLPILPIQFADFVLWQQKLNASEKFNQQRDYWQKKLAYAPSMLDLPIDYKRPKLQTFNGSTVLFNFDQVLCQEIYIYSQKMQISIYTLLLTSFAILLHHYSQQNDIIIGTLSANRNRPELKNLIGFLVNTLPIRLHVSDKQNLEDLINRVKNTTLEAFDNQDIGFEQILASTGIPTSSDYNPIFQVIFALENFELGDLNWLGISTEFHQITNNISKFDLSLLIKVHNGKLSGELEYNSDLFKNETMSRITSYYKSIVSKLISTPANSSVISDLDFLGEVEKKQLLYTWNKTDSDYEKEKFVHKRFEEQVIKNPDSCAVKYLDEAITYTELNIRSNKLAHYLIKSGLTSGGVVGIRIERSLNSLVSLLAIQKAGGTSLILDASIPEVRLNLMIKDAGVQFIIINNQIKHEDIVKNSIKYINLDEEYGAISKQKDINPDISFASTQAIYITFTSGSTGRPKGIRIAHYSLVNFLCSMLNKPGLDPSDAILSVTSLAFDISCLELFLPLLTGAKIIIAEHTATNDPNKLINYIDRENITCIQATPTTWKMLISAGWMGKKNLRILCGGEPLSSKLAKLLLQRSDSLWNMYGPAETTVWSSIYKVSEIEDFIPIGKPIANTQIYILDKQLQPVPVGVIGELYIGGDGLAIDYLNRPDLTATSFLNNPYCINKRIYRTGDFGKFLSNGNIVLLGRKDNQVKVNGYRVELNDIEAHICMIPFVKEAAVKVINDISINSNKLIGYVVKKSEQSPISDLRSILLKQLPSYMVPSHFLFLEKILLTTSGKIDRNALPVPDLFERESSLNDYHAPQTNSEKILTEVWQEVLGIKKIGIHDNYFDLGGASLQSVRIASKAAKNGLVITPEMIFEYQTIHELAKIAVYDQMKEIQKATSEVGEIEPFKANKTASTNQKQTPLIIESLGCYLPKEDLLSNIVVENCKHKIRFPIERLTGIYSRKSVSYGEYAIDLAVKAVEDCFSKSEIAPSEVDIIITSHIFRCDNNQQFTFEPSAAIQIKQHFGCYNAICFDLTNACAGLFSAIYVVKNLIAYGPLKRALIVSGEYLTHLTKSAQQEVVDYLDKRVSGLTVGDAGIAMLLEESADNSVGFQDIEIFTMGEYSNLCTAEITQGDHGGLILNTDAIRMNEAGHAKASEHTLNMLRANNWQFDNVDFLIMHQASSTTLGNAILEVNKLLKRDVLTEKNTIDNLKYRGNTGTTTHWVALHDNINKGIIQDNNKITFCISGSGLNVGTALYSLDNLPSKIKNFRNNAKEKPVMQTSPPITQKNTYLNTSGSKKICILSIGSIQPTDNIKKETLLMIKIAVKNCLHNCNIDKNKIGLIIHSGVYRSNLLLEPAIAAIIAGMLKINLTNEHSTINRVFAFDIFNGAIGFLQSCYIATQIILSHQSQTALLVASEVDNNESTNKLGIEETASAMMLARSNANSCGFGQFLFRDLFGQAKHYTTYTEWNKASVAIKKDINVNCSESICRSIGMIIQDLLCRENLSLADIKVILLPQFKNLVEILSDEFNMSTDKLIYAKNYDNDLFTSSIPYLLNHVIDSKKVSQGDIGILVSIGSGGQMGCVTYYF